MLRNLYEKCSIIIEIRISSLLVISSVLSQSYGIINTPTVADCAKPGIRMGAGLGAVAGGTAGAALLTHLGIGSITYASCPALAMTTMAGTGTGILAGPLLPIGMITTSTSFELLHNKSLKFLILISLRVINFREINEMLQVD